MKNKNKKLLFRRDFIKTKGKDTDMFLGKIVFKTQDTYFVSIPGYKGSLIKFDKEDMKGLEDDE